MVQCCVTQCKNRSERKKKGTHGITFHLFPRNVVKRELWTNALQRMNWTPSPTSAICSVHFEETYFYKTKNGLIRLQEDSVPTLQITPGNNGRTVSNNKNICEKQNESHSKILPDLPVLKIPIIEENDLPKEKLLASHVKRMLLMCQKQRKTIRSLQQKLRIQEIVMEKFKDR